MLLSRSCGTTLRQPLSHRRAAGLGVVAMMSAAAACGSTAPTDVQHGTVPSASVSAASARIVSRLQSQTQPGQLYESVRAVVVVVRGRTVVEFYDKSTADTSHNVYSVTKSVMSTLVGVALAEGRLRSLDQALGELLPDYARDMTPGVAKITLRQLLTMGSGLPGDEDRDVFTQASDWVAGILRQGVTGTPNTFNYGNAGPHLLSAILARATGRSVLDYARAKLFDPLRVVTRPAASISAVDDSAANGARYDEATFTWPVDPKGNNLGWTLLKLRPSDLVKIGRLYLDQGRWEGRQVLPATWVQQSTATQVAAHGFGEGYGYGWWTTTADGKPAYAAAGYGGQLIEVVPALRMVVVIASAADGHDPTSHGIDPTNLEYLVSATIAPAFRDRT